MRLMLRLAVCMIVAGAMAQHVLAQSETAPPALTVERAKARYDNAEKPMIDYFLAFEESCNRFPGFSYEVQGVYRVIENDRIKFFTYVVKE